jgi:hypothetical protein
MINWPRLMHVWSDLLCGMRLRNNWDLTPIPHYAATLGAKSSGFEYTSGNASVAIPMQGQVTVNNAEAYQAACLAGLGLIQAPFCGYP